MIRDLAHVQNRRTQIIVISSLLVIHIFIDLLILSFFSNKPREMAIVAVPFSQCSLTTLWAACSRIKSYVRFPLAIFSAAWTWLVFSVVSMQFDPDQTIDTVFLFVAQVGFIFFMYYFSRALAFIVSRRRKTKEPSHAPAFQYSIGAMLIWTAVFALFLGLGKSVLTYTGWSPKLIQSNYFIDFFVYAGAVGVCNAVVALIVLVAAKRQKNRMLSFLVAWIGIALFGWIAFRVLDNLCVWIFSEQNLILDLLIQAFCLFATLLPLRWCGLLGENEEDGLVSSSIKTSSDTKA
ncbi:MAG: hypothetical protein IT426_18320 [Pirellulales bacterium]|nr:hypothetical protein [Pirellulales bacterium]